jgi:Protein of unknown function (DUF3048) N-terminal domain/Protein of unknown function (DUF3048) C-terminal domain
MALSRSRTALLSGGIGVTLVVAAVSYLAVSRPLAVASPTPAPPSASPAPSPEARPSRTPKATPKPSRKPKPKVAAPHCPLNGADLANEKVLRRPALAVQIDAHPDALPTRNLSRADMVVEATVEGDVTRYTGIYLCRKTFGLTGPVRSGRYYLIDLWQDMRVLPFFFGSSSEAIHRYQRAHMPFVNGISGRWPWFRRVCCNVAPHNLYAEINRVRRAFGRGNELDALAARVRRLRPPFHFDEKVRLPEGRRLHRIEIWTNDYWHFGWSWRDRELGWERSDGGVKHVDAATGYAIRVTTVLVQRVRQSIVYTDPDPAGNPRRAQHLVGRGKGTLYVHGRAIAVRWVRPTREARTTWRYERSGRRVILPPGTVWWEIVPISGRVRTF